VKGYALIVLLVLMKSGSTIDKRWEMIHPSSSQEDEQDNDENEPHRIISQHKNHITIMFLCHAQARTR
jgi:hypothetical protein